MKGDLPLSRKLIDVCIVSVLICGGHTIDQPMNMMKVKVYTCKCQKLGAYDDSGRGRARKVCRDESGARGGARAAGRVMRSAGGASPAPAPPPAPRGCA